MCLAQGHNAVMLVRLEPTVPPSRIKHSTNEPLHSHKKQNKKTPQNVVVCDGKVKSVLQGIYDPVIDSNSAWDI